MGRDHRLMAHRQPGRRPDATPVDTDRAGTPARVVLNAVIFCDFDTNWTPTGIYLDKAAQPLEPSLPALTTLAIPGE